MGGTTEIHKTLGVEPTTGGQKLKVLLRGASASSADDWEGRTARAAWHGTCKIPVTFRPRLQAFLGVRLRDRVWLCIRRGQRIRVVFTAKSSYGGHLRRAPTTGKGGQRVRRGTAHTRFRSPSGHRLQAFAGALVYPLLCIWEIVREIVCGCASVVDNASEKGGVIELEDSCRRHPKEGIIELEGILRI